MNLVLDNAQMISELASVICVLSIDQALGKRKSSGMFNVFQEYLKRWSWLSQWELLDHLRITYDHTTVINCNFFLFFQAISFSFLWVSFSLYINKYVELSVLKILHSTITQLWFSSSLSSSFTSLSKKTRQTRKQINNESKIMWKYLFLWPMRCTIIANSTCNDLPIKLDFFFKNLPNHKKHKFHNYLFFFTTYFFDVFLNK